MLQIVRVTLWLTLLLCAVSSAQTKSTWNSSTGSTVILTQGADKSFQAVTIKGSNGQSLRNSVTSNGPKTFSYVANQQRIDATFRGPDEIILTANSKFGKYDYRWTRRNGRAPNPIPNTETCTRQRFDSAHNDSSSYFLLYTKNSLSALYTFKLDGKLHVSSLRGKWLKYPRSFRVFGDRYSDDLKFVNPGVITSGALFYYYPNSDYQIQSKGKRP